MLIEDPASPWDIYAAVLRDPKRFPKLDAKLRSSSSALESAAMSARTDQVKWWKTPGQNAPHVYLLSQKMFARLGCQGTPYRIASSEVRGFQFGNPAVAPYCVKLDLFDAADHHYALTINSGAHGPVITQAEVNAMVASLQPIGAN